MTSPKQSVLCVCKNPACKVPYGYCHCNCGMKTAIHKASCASRGIVRGTPRLFCRHHQRTSPCLSSTAYEIEDRGYKTPCWIWKKYLNWQGYGKMTYRGKNGSAHIFYWKAKYGEVPEGKELDHLCRVTACVNPDHLEAVTHRENTRRRSTSKLTMDKARQIRLLYSQALTTNPWQKCFQSLPNVLAVSLATGDGESDASYFANSSSVGEHPLA